jgi:hypothetical protein
VHKYLQRYGVQEEENNRKILTATGIAASGYPEVQYCISTIVHEGTKYCTVRTSTVMHPAWTIVPIGNDATDFLRTRSASHTVST